MSRRRPNPGAEELVFLPLGGAGEIGMNFYLYGHGPVHKRRWLIVDMGVKLVNQNEFISQQMYKTARKARLPGNCIIHGS